MEKFNMYDFRVLDAQREYFNCDEYNSHLENMHEIVNSEVTFSDSEYDSRLKVTRDIAETKLLEIAQKYEVDIKDL